MFELTIQTEFAASHALRDYDGPCSRVHGHNFRVEVEVTGETLDDRGMLIDFVELKARTRAITDALDHRHLNELPMFAATNPTAENLARHVYERLAADLPAGVRLAAVTVRETDRAAATFRPRAGAPTEPARAAP